MSPDELNRSGQPPLNEASSRLWTQLADLGVGSWWSKYPATYVPPKNAINDSPVSTNYFASAAVRVNSDGFVCFRGVLKRPSGTIVTGDVVGYVPRHLMPRHNSEYRFAGGPCILKINPVSGALNVDVVLVGGNDFVVLNNVQYYLD